jgi:hypothetical protein
VHRNSQNPRTDEEIANLVVDSWLQHNDPISTFDEHALRMYAMRPDNNKYYAPIQIVDNRHAHQESRIANCRNIIEHSMRRGGTAEIALALIPQEYADLSQKNHLFAHELEEKGLPPLIYGVYEHYQREITLEKDKLLEVDAEQTVASIEQRLGKVNAIDRAYLVDYAKDNNPYHQARWARNVV